MELCAAPTWLVDLLTKRPETTPAPSNKPVNASTYGRRALEGEVGKVVLAPVGQRNDTLNRAAFSLGQLVATGVLDPYDVANALLTAASRAGLEEVESRNTIASGLKAGLAQPRSVAP